METRDRILHALGVLKGVSPPQGAPMYSPPCPPPEGAYSPPGSPPEGATPPALPAGGGAGREALAEILRGEWRDTPDGPAFVKDTWLPLDHRHGAGCVGSALEAPIEALRIAFDDAGVTRPERLAFFDVETTGLSGGTGTYVFLAGLGSFDAGKFRLRQYFLADIGRERSMLAFIARDLCEFEGIVTYNGRAFDLPIVETRMTLGRIPSRLRGLLHLDLLHPVRSLCRHRLPACRLADAETFLLCLRREDDVPGHLIPSLYFDYVRAGRVAPLRAVLRHNGWDVLSMVGILSWVAGLLTREDSHEIEPGDAAALARFWELRREPARAVELYRNALPRLEGDPRWARAAERYALLLKRGGSRAAAVGIWRRLWSDGDLASAIEIAKYLEHEARDLAGAEEVTRAVLGSCGPDDQPSVEHRLARLRRKMGEGAATSSAS